MDKYFPTIFSCVQAQRQYFFNGDRKHSRNLYDATCVTYYDDEDIVLMIVLEDNNIQVYARCFGIHVLWRITFFRYAAKVQNQRHDYSLLLHGRGFPSCNLFVSFLVFTIHQDRSSNQKSGGGIAASCRSTVLYNTESFINKIKNWDACSFYHFYDAFSDKSRLFGIWVVMYQLVKRGLSDTRGFVCGNQFKNETVMIPDRYTLTLRSMSYKILYRRVMFNWKDLPNDDKVYYKDCVAKKLIAVNLI